MENQPMTSLAEKLLLSRVPQRVSARVLRIRLAAEGASAVVNYAASKDGPPRIVDEITNAGAASLQSARA